MRIFVLGDEEAVLGFSLTGVGGQVAGTPAEVQEGLRRAVADRDIGILLLTADAARMAREEVDRLRLAVAQPLILEIPSSQGLSTEISIREFISRAIGVHL